MRRPFWKESESYGKIKTYHDDGGQKTLPNGVKNRGEQKNKTP